MSFLEELIKKGVINASQMGEINSRAQSEFNGNIDEALVAFGVPEEKILEAKGEYLNLPIKQIDPQKISFDALKYIPEDSANHYHFVPIGLTEGILEVGVIDPENIQVMDALQFISNKIGVPFKVFLISKTAYEDVMQAYKGIGSQVNEALKELNKEEETENKSFSEENLSKEIKNIKPGEESKIVEDAPVIKIVAVILRNALEGNASDIHIEYNGEKVKVRFRVDGILHTSIVLPPNVYSGIVARIKILSKLRLDEKRKPQDGSFSANIDGRKIDFRVSTMPAYYGES
jgi:type IV pilus assembly protein PilB